MAYLNLPSEGLWQKETIVSAGVSGNSSKSGTISLLSPPTGTNWNFKIKSTTFIKSINFNDSNSISYQTKKLRNGQTATIQFSFVAKKPGTNDLQHSVDNQNITESIDILIDEDYFTLSSLGINNGGEVGNSITHGVKVYNGSPYTLTNIFVDASVNLGAHISYLNGATGEFVNDTPSSGVWTIPSIISNGSVSMFFKIDNINVTGDLNVIYQSSSEQLVDIEIVDTLPIQ